MERRELAVMAAAAMATAHAIRDRFMLRRNDMLEIDPFSIPERR